MGRELMVSKVLLGLTVANQEVKSGDSTHGLPHLMAGTTDLCFARKSKQRDTEKLE